MSADSTTFFAILAVAAVIAVMLFMFTVCAALLGAAYWLSNKTRMAEIERAYGVATMQDARSQRLDNKAADIYTAVVAELAAPKPTPESDEVSVNVTAKRLTELLRKKEGLQEESEPHLNGLKRHSLVSANAYDPNEGI